MQRAFIIFIALAGCKASSGDEGLALLNNTSLAAATTCALMGTAGQPFQAQGQISSFSNLPYILTPFLESRITADMGEEVQRTVVLEGARVDLSVAAAYLNNQPVSVAMPPGTSKFTALFAGDVAPNGGTANVAFDLVPVPVIAGILSASGATSTDHLNVTLASSVVVYGMMGGGEVDSNPFDYPVTICNDCVVNDLGLCKGLMSTQVRLGNPCNPFQDGVVDCCDGASGLVCPAIATM